MGSVEKRKSQYQGKKNSPFQSAPMVFYGWIHYDYIGCSVMTSFYSGLGQIVFKIGDKEGSFLET